MEFKLLKLASADREQFETDMQEAFNKGAESYSGKEEHVLPEADIEEALNTEGAVAYKVMMDEKMVGGAIVNIDPATKHNRLDFLYVKAGYQGKRIGQQIWQGLEKRYPQTTVWETCTPYFDQRNIHFYINKLGFHAVEFYNQYHQDPAETETYAGHNSPGMFRFEKKMPGNNGGKSQQWLENSDHWWLSSSALSDACLISGHASFWFSKEEYGKAC